MVTVPVPVFRVEPRIRLSVVSVALPLVVDSAPVMFSVGALSTRAPLPLKPPSFSVLASAKLTAEPLTTVTAPVKSLVALASVMGLALPAVRQVVPGTVRAPDCVIAPPATTIRFLPVSRVVVGRARAVPVVMFRLPSGVAPIGPPRLVVPVVVVLRS